MICSKKIIKIYDQQYIISVYKTIKNKNILMLY